MQVNPTPDAYMNQNLTYNKQIQFKLTIIFKQKIFAVCYHITEIWISKNLVLKEKFAQCWGKLKLHVDAIVFFVIENARLH